MSHVRDAIITMFKTIKKKTVVWKFVFTYRPFFSGIIVTARIVFRIVNYII